MTDPKDDRPDDVHSGRRSLLIGAGAMATGEIAASLVAQVPVSPRSAGPIVPGRDSQLAGKVAFVTGAARGISVAKSAGARRASR